MSDELLRFHPLTPDRWTDFEALFGPRGACAGCWCMWWRQSRTEFDRNKGEPNRAALQAIVERGEIPGIIAYADGRPVGWCAVAPRESFSALARSRILKPVDDQPVWSVVCFFVARGYRRRGLTVQLLKAAVDYVREQGGRIVEGYPSRPAHDQADGFVYRGVVSAFVRAGFQEVARPTPARSVMRYIISTAEGLAEPVQRLAPDQHEPMRRVAAALAEVGREADFRVFETHLPTAPAAAEATGVELGRIAKSIVLRVGDGPVLVVAAGDRRVDRTKVKALLNRGKVHIASADEVLFISGFVAGGVAPVGWLQAPTVLLDESLQRYPDVWAGGGVPEALLRLPVADLPLLTGGQFADVCEAW